MFFSLFLLFFPVCMLMPGSSIGFVTSLTFFNLTLASPATAHQLIVSGITCVTIFVVSYPPVYMYFLSLSLLHLHLVVSLLLSLVNLVISFSPFHSLSLIFHLMTTRLICHLWIYSLSLDSFLLGYFIYPASTAVRRAFSISCSPFFSLFSSFRRHFTSFPAFACALLAVCFG